MLREKAPVRHRSDGVATELTTRRSLRKPHSETRCRLALQPIGTAGFEFNGPHAGPLFYRHLRARSDRIGTYRLLWTGKHYGKHICRVSSLSWLSAASRRSHEATPARQRAHRTFSRSMMAWMRGSDRMGA